MIVKIIGYVGLGAVALLLVQTLMTTLYLSRIDAGLQTSLDTTASLVDIQNAIIHKNEALQDVVETTKAMDAQLNGTLHTTQSIHAHIDQINELNGATLQLNEQMADTAKQSGKTLQSVSGSLSELKSASANMDQSIAKLKQWVRQDSDSLDRMRAYTDEMNGKLPGVLK